MYRPSPNFYAAAVLIALGVVSAAAYGLLVYHITRTFT